MDTTQKLTIWGVDEATKRLLKARARQQGVSLNAYSLEVLRREVGTSSTKDTNGLERFAGATLLDSKVEAALHDQRRVAPDKRDHLESNL